MNIFTRYGIIPASTVRFEPILLKHDAGLMDFSVTGANNLYWIFPDGTTSTLARPAKTVGAGITKVYCDNWDSSDLTLNNNTTKDIFTGSLADFGGKLEGSFTLANCINATGSLADLQGKLKGSLNLTNDHNIIGSFADLQGNLTKNLNVAFCYNLIGSLADLQGNLRGTLYAPGCYNLIGSLADLQGNLTSVFDLSECSNITGVYTPVGSGTPISTYLSNTGLSASDMDATLINYANAAIPKSNGTFEANEMSRTAASDAAIETLVGRGWTISGLTKI